MWDKHSVDAVSSGLVAVIAILSVSLIVIGATIPVQASITGAVVAPAFRNPDWRHSYDFNGDGVLDAYDFADISAGAVDCNRHDCDLNDDGIIGAQDKDLYLSLLDRLYDYDSDGALTRADIGLLDRIIAGAEGCGQDRLCDVDGDGRLSHDDASHYVSFLFSYEPMTR